MQASANRQPTMDLSGESDEDILLYLAAGDEQQIYAAREQFFVRFYPYIVKRCKKYCATMHFAHCDAEDFASDVLIVAIEHAGTFDVPDGLNPSVVTNHIKAWLGRIAENCVVDAMRSKNGYSLDSGDLERDHASTYLDCETTPPNRSIPYRDALAALSVEDQQLLQAYYAERSLNNPRGRGPQGISKALAEEYGLTTTAALRKRIERINKKLMNAVSTSI